jgi:hypothetical protein
MGPVDIFFVAKKQHVTHSGGSKSPNRVESRPAVCGARLTRCANSAFPSPIHPSGEQYEKQNDLSVDWVSGGGTYQLIVFRLF